MSTFDFEWDESYDDSVVDYIRRHSRRPTSPRDVQLDNWPLLNLQYPVD